MLLRKELTKATRYFEWGAGESTKLAVRQQNVVQVHSAESDRDFIETELLTDEFVRESVESGRLKFHLVDIGPTGRWGRPIDNHAQHKWGAYAEAISADEAQWDLVLVDGLFRVACVAAALLKSPDVRLLIHDFWRRKRYRPVLNFCEEIETADQLVLVRRRKEADDELITRFLRKHNVLPTDKTPWLKLQSKIGIKT